jgi:hypothetical protein
VTVTMAGDRHLLERLASLPAVPVSVLEEVLADRGSARDPLLAGLVGVDEQGDMVVHPLVPSVMKHMRRRPDATCNAALLEALTGIWNAAVRGAVVGRLRSAGLPPDDLLLRLRDLSPTLGLRDEDRQWARAWVADPTAQDSALVQQCVVRLLLALRGLAESRARALTADSPAAPESPAAESP